VFLTSLFLLVAVLFYPFMDTLKVPAHLAYKENIRLYAPTDSLVNNVVIKRGDQVKQGQVLANLSSAQLDLNLASLDKELNLIDIKLAEPTGSGLDNRQSLLNEKSALLSARQGVLDKRAKLQLTTPINGIVDYIDDSLAKGVSVAENTLLFDIVAKDSALVTVYINESDLNKVRPSSAEFIPENTDFEKIVLDFQERDVAAMKTVDSLLMLAVNGGEIAAYQRDQHYVPQQALYKWRYDVLADNVLPALEMRGIAVLKTEPYSIMSQFVHYVMAALVREMGF